jgi:hypothetical protein
MPLLKSLHRNTLSSTILTQLLTKIQKFVTEKQSRFNVRIGHGLRFKGTEVTGISINPSSDPALTFNGGPNFGTVAASKAIQDLTYTAKKLGTNGNLITIAYTTGGTAGSEVVTVVGNAISVQIQSGVSTATQVKTKIDANTAAAALVNVAITGTAGTAQVAVGATALINGSNVRTYNRADIRLIKRLRTRKYLIVIKPANGADL